MNPRLFHAIIATLLLIASAGVAVLVARLSYGSGLEDRWQFGAMWLVGVAGGYWLRP
jgi:hypothetical protein